jgi:hypothetical protein
VAGRVWGGGRIATGSGAEQGAGGGRGRCWADASGRSPVVGAGEVEQGIRVPRAARRSAAAYNTGSGREEAADCRRPCHHPVFIGTRRIYDDTGLEQLERKGRCEPRQDALARATTACCGRRGAVRPDRRERHSGLLRYALHPRLRWQGEALGVSSCHWRKAVRSTGPGGEGCRKPQVAGGDGRRRGRSSPPAEPGGGGGSDGRRSC